MTLYEFQFVDQHGRLRTTRAPKDILERLHREADRWDTERQRQRPRFEQPSYRDPYRNAYPGQQYPNPRQSPNRPPSSDPFADLNDLFSNLGGGFEAFARAERERKEEERKRKAREEEARKQRASQPKFTSVSAWVRLCTVAGVDETTPRSEKARIIRKAQRKCHPDTGGSHDEWVKLEDILRRI